jgi:hypothetical protein
MPGVSADERVGSRSPVLPGLMCAYAVSGLCFLSGGVGTARTSGATGVSFEREAQVLMVTVLLRTLQQRSVLDEV